MKYNRDVLVSYLTEVYGIEMVRDALIRKRNQIENLIQQDRANIAFNNPMPEKPTRKIEIGQVLGDFLLENISEKFCLLVLIGAGYGLLFVYDIVGLILMGIGVLGFIMYLYDSIQVEKYRCEAELIEYNTKIRQYENNEKIKNNSRNLIESRESSLAGVKSELSICDSMRNKVYSENIIPGNYRNTASARFLFNFISTSQETDITQILQVMLLDRTLQEIKVIRQQLNQIINNHYSIMSELDSIRTFPIHETI